MSIFKKEKRSALIIPAEDKTQSPIVREMRANLLAKLAALEVQEKVLRAMHSEAAALEQEIEWLARNPAAEKIIQQILDRHEAEKA